MNGSISILTYGGIRGGISLALALALLTTNGTNKELSNLLIGMTFISVLMSNLIQGMTLKYMISAFYGSVSKCSSEAEFNANINECGSENKTNSPTLLEKLDAQLQLLFNKLNTGCKNDIGKSAILNEDNKQIEKEDVNNSYDANSSIVKNVEPVLNNDFLENEVVGKYSNSSHELTDSELDLDNMTELEKDQL